ncbi:MAG: NAD(P)-dependent oxidoreductase [Candidatus Electrothrix sp. AR4]|nr:NAD(P)-dependent oxidoreductase [Candidatus Electrothrix sp. AR4]
MIEKNILVTGAGGFLGWHTGNYFSELGHQVDGMDLHFPEQPLDGRKPLFNTLEQDFRDWNLTEKALANKEVVFHLASAHLQISLDESEYWDVNVHGLRTLLEKAHQAGVQRFVHISSVGTYGKLETVPADENTPCHPQSIYGETKLAGEKEVVAFCKESGMDYVILRPAWVYGQGCPRTAKLQRMLRKKRFIMIGKGANKRHPMYIKDMLESFRLAMERDEAVGEMMIIGGEQIVTTHEMVFAFSSVLNLPEPLVTLPYPLGAAIAAVAEALFSIIGKEPPVSRRTLEFFNTDNGFDISKSKKILNFIPKYTLEQGLRDYAETISSL